MIAQFKVDRVGNSAPGLIERNGPEVVDALDDPAGQSLWLWGLSELDQSLWGLSLSQWEPGGGCGVW